MTPQLFKFKGQQVRTLTINGEAYFVGSDVAEALGYSQKAKAVREHVPEQFKGVSVLDTPGGKQKLVVISEPGVYKLAFSSHAKNAENFTNWVASEVLPAIRKHGAYITKPKARELLTDPKGWIDMLRRSADLIQQQDIQIQQMKPKALFADAVGTSNSTILIGELAKILKANGVENIGQNRLFAKLREMGYLIKRKGTDYNMPTQRSMELGLFKIKETTIARPDGHITISKTPKVTGKGQQYFIDLFLRKQVSNHG